MYFVPPTSHIHAPPIFISGSDLTAVMSTSDALRHIERYLMGGFDPENDAPRTRLDIDKGQFLQMPSTSGSYTGTKLLTICPDNAVVGEPVIQGLYVLFGERGQRPLAVIDGQALTNVRTPAVSALGAVRLLSTGPQSLVIFGTGPQAWEHIRALNSVLTLSRVDIVGRSAAAVESMVEKARAIGIDAAASNANRVAEADLVICCTAAKLPLFDGTLVKNSAVVVAIGSHQPEHRELDDALMSRASIYVESKQSSMREAGDIIGAMASGVVRGPERLNTLAELVSGRKPRPEGRPAVFKTTGMPWQDLAVAVAAYEACSSGLTEPKMVSRHGAAYGGRGQLAFSS